MIKQRLKAVRKRVRRILGLKRPDQRPANLRKRFAGVYRDGGWGSAESLSGPGSERDSGSVRQALKVLRKVAGEHQVRSMVDIPCGDFNWMPLFLEENPELKYLGYDVVPEIVARNRRRNRGVKFQALDITRRIPAKADLVFSKDLINHLMEKDVWAALANMVRSGAPYLLITSNGKCENEELAADIGGSSRLLNLQAAPYNFPPPLYDDGYLALWRTTDLAFLLNRQA